MYSILDCAGETVGRLKTSADRACDQCKSRKVRCDMTKPCSGCSKKGFGCTYEKARKRRGPAGKRIQEIHRQQQKSNDGQDGSQTAGDLDSSTCYNANSIANISACQEQVELYLTPSSGSNDAVQPGFNEVSSRAQFCYLEAPARRDSNVSLTIYDHSISDKQSSHSATLFEKGMGRVTMEVGASPTLSDVLFPSLPIESPSLEFDSFGLIPQKELSPLMETTYVWPQNINEESLLPWIDIYFKRLNPIGPLINRTTIYHGMLLRKHRTDSQYGAMLLGLCAFAMSQPIQIHEHASTLSRSVQASILMDECVKMRMTADFGERPTIEMVLTSLFLFSCLFNSNKQRAATLRLQEAVSLAQILGLHLPESYPGLDAETREQWLRTYLALSVTER